MISLARLPSSTTRRTEADASCSRGTSRFNQRRQALAEDTIAASGFEFIQKPFPFDDLVARITERLSEESLLRQPS